MPSASASSRKVCRTPSTTSWPSIRAGGRLCDRPEQRTWCGCTPSPKPRTARCSWRSKWPTLCSTGLGVLALGRNWPRSKGGDTHISLLLFPTGTHKLPILPRIVLVCKVISMQIGY
uniref:(northern house mosquito) hypothetical protein n=1 Tax=Culex pipiens TaxID=7175 RepID=A0A8D8A0S6_CULPI